MPAYWDAEKKQYRYKFNRVIGGQRYRFDKRLPKSWTRQQAEAWGRKEDERIEGLASGGEREELISDALAAYIEGSSFRSSKRHAVPTTIEGIAEMLPYISGRTISQFPELVDDYRRDNPGHAPATQRNRIAYIRAGLRWAYAHQLIKTPVPPVVLPKVENERHVYLRLDEQLRLLSLINDDEARALFTLTFWTGCRWESEILNLRQESIRFIDANPWLDLGQTKNGRRKMKWVREEARWCLDFVPWKHARTWFYNRFRTAAKAAGLGWYRIHDMRHSLASEVISNGGTLSDVGAVLGHESMQSSARYAHLYPERQVEVLKRVGKK